MDSSLVLQAATCWTAWWFAIGLLQEKGYNSEDATKWLQARFWDLTRVPEPLYRQLVDNVITYGLWGSVRLHTDNWSDGDSLLMIIWCPVPRWVHLLNPTGRRERNLQMHPYHISVCYMRDVWKAYSWKRHMLYDLWVSYETEVYTTHLQAIINRIPKSAK